jgi:hypothetical protein
MPRARPIKIVAPDLERYAVVRPGGIEWDAAMALASRHDRRVFERLGIAQFERASDRWKAIEAHVAKFQAYANKSRPAS